MIPSSSARLTVALVVTLLLWGSAFAAIRRGLDGYSPYHLALLRFFIAAMVIGALTPWLKVRRPDREDWPRVIGAGLMSVTLYHCALNYGQQTVTAGAASFMINTVPIFTSLIAVFVLREQVTRAHWGGIAVSFAGIALITLGEGRNQSNGAGAWFILLAALSQSFCFILLKPLLKKYSSFEITCYTLWSGTLFLGIFLPGLGQAIKQADLTSTLAVIYLGIFPAAVAHFCWTFVLRQVPASRATSYLYAVPPLALAMAWAWLGEVPAVLSLAGCGLALGGVLIVNQAGKVKSIRATL